MKISLLLMSILLPALVSAQLYDLKGEWTIDLRPTPDSEGYFQEFIVSEVNESKFEGTFYGSPIENGLLNTNWEKPYFAFSTRDQNHSYYHSGYLLEGVLYGISYCPGREFTAPWTGTKK